MMLTIRSWFAPPEHDVADSSATENSNELLAFIGISFPIEMNWLNDAT